MRPKVRSSQEVLSSFFFHFAYNECFSINVYIHQPWMLNKQKRTIFSEIFQISQVGSYLKKKPCLHDIPKTVSDQGTKP